MSKLILGVDGGATKSHLALFDSNGKCAGATAYGPLNHEAMEGSYAELEERLGELLPRVLREAGATVNDVAYAVFGMAGVDTDAQEKHISEMVRKLGFERFIMCNDAFLGVAAGCPDCVGICAINGTGFKLAAVDHSGAAVQTCGIGEFTDDRGGGSWYGHRAIGEVYSELYRLGRPTVMREMFFELLGITRREDYLEVLTEKYYSGKLDRVAVNSVPFNAAALGDAVALDLLDESAEKYAGGIARLIMDMVFPANLPLYVTLAGSVFVRQKVKILHEMIDRRVSEALGGRHVEYLCLDAPPVAGAVIWAAQKAGFDAVDMPAIKDGIISSGLM